VSVMPSTITLVLFALATLLQTATPGPGVIYLSTRTLTQGRRAGFASMFGIESGEVVWIAAAATGVAALLVASPDALAVLRFAGAAYLIYLGVRRWRRTEPIGTPQPAPLGRLFAQGFLTQILNPKVTLFFVAFLPLFLDPRAAVLPQVAILGAVYIAVAIVVDTSYVLGLAALSRRFMSSRIAQKRAGRVAAGTYVALGLAAAVGGRLPA
jgi:threonine/homoserine/homoserine lactone efflux protein